MTNASHELKYEYIYRVNRAIDYIRTHAADNLELDNIAKIACVSKYHFHRIFRSQTGETINEFVQRLRLEYAFYKLGIEGDKSITEIALECGFSSSQNFAKAFKKYFDVSPKFVKGGYNWYKMRGMGNPINNLPEKEVCPKINYFSDPDHKRFNLIIKRITEQKKPINVNIVKMPSFHVLYTRIIGGDPTKSIEAAEKLNQWARARELLNENSIFLIVSRSDPFITSPEKSIYEECVTIPEKIERVERYNIQDIPGGKYAVYHCEMDLHDPKDDSSIKEEWFRFLVEWLRTSGYKPDNRPLYQIFCNDFKKHPLKHLITDLCLPIKPA